MTTKKTYTIDAAGKSLGRVASQAASILMGKNTTSFARNVFPDVTVTVENASQIKLTSEKKITKSTYKTYSGYPSGLKQEKLGELATRRGYSEVLKRTIQGMISGNRLRPRIMKNLIIKE